MSREKQDRIQLYLPRVMLAELTELSEATGTPLSEVVRNALSNHLAVSAARRAKLSAVAQRPKPAQAPHPEQITLL